VSLREPSLFSVFGAHFSRWASAIRFIMEEMRAKRPMLLYDLEST